MPQALETLADRWTLVEKIDEGAMGEIFRGTHAVLGHAVAVKVLQPTVSRDRSATDRFLREARIAAKLQHRNVVRVEDFGVAADDRPFLVMELLRGESLARRLARAPALTPREALDIVRQIAAALDVAHAAGIIHRDLKPENIFLAEADGAVTVKVLDFGVAKFTDVLANGGHATASNTLVGTPRYMSPEQARSSRQLDGRSDLWALGMIAYEMLTGAHPFEGEAIAELLVAILTHRIAPPTSVCPQLPPEVDDWAARALARSRYERFATGHELVEALASALAEAPEGPAARAVASRRGATVRVTRPEPAEAPPSRLKQTPPEGPAPVTVPVREEPTPARGVSAATDDLTPPPRVPPTRRSWTVVALAAVLVGAVLVVAARVTIVRGAANVAARDVNRATTAALTATPTPTTTTQPEAPARAAPPTVLPAAPSEREPLPPPPAEAARRASRRHHHRRGDDPVSEPGTRTAPAQPVPQREGRSGLYDPSGI